MERVVVVNGALTSDGEHDSDDYDDDIGDGANTTGELPTLLNLEDVLNVIPDEAGQQETKIRAHQYRTDPLAEVVAATVLPCIQCPMLTMSQKPVAIQRSAVLCCAVCQPATQP